MSVKTTDKRHAARGTQGGLAIVPDEPPRTVAQIAKVCATQMDGLLESVNEEHGGIFTRVTIIIHRAPVIAPINSHPWADNPLKKR